MKHHLPEEWLLFMDGEASPELSRSLSEHLASCPDCASELAGWKRSAEKLRRMPSPKRSRRRVPEFVKLGLAAAFVLFCGIAIGRLSQPNATELKRAIAEQVKQELRSELRADVTGAKQEVEQQRESDRQHFAQLLANVRAQDVADCLALRQDLETAVSEADADLRLNSRRITELASSVVATPH